jgi:hypothetical protein
VLHLDSTGTVVRRIPEQKQPYLYSAILAGENIPVMEFITTDHRSFSLSAKLEYFLADCREMNHGMVVLPTVIVTDFSYALINAVLISFNKMSLLAYLKLTYESLTSGKSLKSLTILALCCAHMMKAVANR